MFILVLIKQLKLKDMKIVKDVKVQAQKKVHSPLLVRVVMALEKYEECKGLCLVKL